MHLNVQLEVTKFVSERVGDERKSAHQRDLEALNYLASL